MLLAAPLVVWFSLRGLQSMHTSPVEWVPKSDPERQAYDRFTDHFGREDAVVVSWKGCTVDDRRLHHLQMALRLADRERVAAGKPRQFRNVIDGYSLSRQLYDLIHDPNGSERKAAEARQIVAWRMLGTFLGPDGTSSCAVVTLSESGLLQRQQAIDQIRRTAFEVCSRDEDFSAEDIYLAGPPVETAAVDRESVQAIMYFSVPTALISLLLCLICLRSVPYTIAIILTAAYGEGLVLAMVNLAGVELNAVLIIMPTLVFVLTTSAGIHLTNYYIDEVRLRGTHGSVTRALHHGWLPCLLAVGTTVLGLGSLTVSEIMPIRQFGIFSSLGLVAAVCLLFLTLPGVLSKWHFQPRKTSDVGASSGLVNPLDNPYRSNRAVTLVSDVVLLAFLLLMTACAIGLPRLEANADVRALLEPRNRLNRDIAKLEESIAPLTPVEILLRYEPGGDMNFIDRLELVRDIQAILVDRKSADAAAPDEVDSRVRGTMSAATFGPLISERPIRRAIQNRVLIEHQDKYVNLGFLSFEEESEAEIWRISVRVDVGDNLDYEQYLDQLRQKVIGAVHAKAGSDEQNYSVVLTGGMPLSDRAHRAMLRDMYRSFFTAVVLVALAMIFILRHLIAGLLVMLPNVFPIVLVFGIMGWSGWQLDIGTIMTASVALGIAVDDTLHFVAWYRRETAAGLSPFNAAKKSMRHCGKAMLQTTLICGLGLSVLGLGPILGLSAFLPLQRFGFMMFVLLSSALIGDLILLPAILVGPVGRFFNNQRTKHTVSDTDDDAKDEVAAETV